MINKTMKEAAAAFAGRAVALLLDSKLPGTAGGGTGGFIFHNALINID